MVTSILNAKKSSLFAEFALDYGIFKKYIIIKDFNKHNILYLPYSFKLICYGLGFFNDFANVSVE